MHEYKTLSLVSVLCGLLLAAPMTYAQGPCGKDGSGPNGTYMRLFDTKSVITIQGEITAIRQAAPMRGMGRAVELELKTDHETISVHLGPDWYVRKQEISLQVKDKLEVKGSRVTDSSRSFLIASELRKGGQVLILRDASGRPVWCGGRRFAPPISES